jgi:hypothetical protein
VALKASVSTATSIYYVEFSVLTGIVGSVLLPAVLPSGLRESMA